MNKNKTSFLNLITGIIPLLIVSVLGIFKSKLFLLNLGTETLGLYNLFSSIMIYVAIVDGGLSSAVLYSLYKPNVEGDRSKFNALLSGARKSFAKIGMIVFAIAFIVSFFVPFLIKEPVFNFNYIRLSFVLFSTSNVISYFFVPYNSLLEVKEKRYIYNLITQVCKIVISIVEIIMLIMGANFISILIMHSVINLISSIVEMLICKKMFPDVNIYSKEKEYDFRSNLKPLLVHKVNGLVSSNIDSILLSGFIGLSSVSIYTTYFYFINMIKNIIDKFYSSLVGIVGNILAKSKDSSYSLYLEYNSFLAFIGTVVCVPLCLSINKFIDIFYEGKIVTSNLIAICFTSYLFVFCMKCPSNLFVSSGGLYKETKKCAIADTICNLLCSIILGKLLGIAGVVIGTLVGAFVGEYFMKGLVIHKYIFGRSFKSVFIKNIKFIIIYILDLLVGYSIISYFSINSLLDWFIIFIIYTLVNGLFILFIYKLMNELVFIDRFKRLVKRG